MPKPFLSISLRAIRRCVIVIMGFMCLYISAQAQNSYSPTDIFTMTTDQIDNDFSISILRLLFGPISNTLNGSTAPTSNPLISEMFRIFNTGVLVMTGILIGYSVLMTTITVSQEGSQGTTGTPG